MIAAGTSIKVERVAKKFCKSLKFSMIYGLNDIARNFVGMSSRPEKLRKKEFWALQDISFELKEGETLGIIGPNGSGKSTLLKMLNGIFWPDKGKITLKGRVGALIEVGAGFHPLLTGRENIYINGAILGMSKQEIQSKFQQIVDFADIGDFLDTPVKNYSSGMFVRLGFAIAVHSNPHILLIDEILAVGDAKFRSKAMERMWEISQKKGIAIVLVSHNMIAVEGFCNKIIYLEHGNAYTGEKAALIARYLGTDTKERYKDLDPQARQKLLMKKKEMAASQTGEIKILSVELTNSSGQKQDTFSPQDTVKIKVDYSSQRELHNVISSISIRDSAGIVLCVERSRFHDLAPFTVSGSGSLEILIKRIGLKAGQYFLGFAFQDVSLNSVYCLRNEDIFYILEDMPNIGGKEGFFSPDIAWNINTGN
jgi:lipopolysaccharide transport system ATP-binding protein